MLPMPMVVAMASVSAATARPVRLSEAEIPPPPGAGKPCQADQRAQRAGHDYNRRWNQQTVTYDQQKQGAESRGSGCGWG